MTQEQETQPQQWIHVEGQPSIPVPEKQNLSALPHLVSDAQYQANKTLINNFRAYKLEQARKEDIK